MQRALVKAKQPNFEILPTFYMASYLLDIICASNPFSRIRWSWFMSRISVHVYCQKLWENKTKRQHAHICDNFLAQVYKLFFYKPYPKTIRGSDAVAQQH
jgi:hypothetical protein